MVQSKQHYRITPTGVGMRCAIRPERRSAGGLVVLGDDGIADGIRNALAGARLQGGPFGQFFRQEQVLHGGSERLSDAFQGFLLVALVQLEASDGGVVELGIAALSQLSLRVLERHTQAADVAARGLVRRAGVFPHRCIVRDFADEPCSGEKTGRGT